MTLNKPQIDPGIYPTAYSPEELRLLVTTSVADDVLFDDLLQKMDGANEASIKFVKSQYESELLNTVKAAIKRKMTELVIDGKKAFIKEARSGITLESTFVKCDQEEMLKNLIVEWFEFGEMSLDVWKTWFVWFNECMTANNDITLKSMRAVRWPTSTRKDTIRSRFLTALNAIEATNFLETDGLRKFLQLQLEPPKIEVETCEYVDRNGKKTKQETTTLNVTGRTIFLSIIKDKLDAKMKTMKQVDIIANNTLNIDCDLNGTVWQGKNIAITANKVNVNGKHIFDVSGMGFERTSYVKRAKDGYDGWLTEAGGNGQNGRDGRAGESSGNIKILTYDMSNPEFLTLKLVGGDGENGESGGNGGDGADGKGVSKSEFDAICISYGSMYWTNWAHFEKYHPDGWNKTSHAESHDRYIYYAFEDEYKRELRYYYSAEKTSWLQFTRYDLIVWIKGSNGTIGGIGGLNGKGGEGGYKGECVVINPDNNNQYPVQKVQLNGANGLDGSVGDCGRPGNNGNDMAVIDRSVGRNESKHYLGDQEHRLSASYSRDNAHYHRLNGYKKACGDSACYAHFNYGSLENGNLRQQRRQKKHERSSQAQRKMKQSIVMSKVVEKAQKHKHEMDSVMATATVSMHAQRFEAYDVDDEVEEEESMEIQHEVMVVKEVDEDKLDGPNARTRKSRLSATEYVAKIREQKDKRLNAQQIIDYFSIEFNEEHLQLLVNDYPILADADSLKNILKSASQHYTFGLSVGKLENLMKCLTDQTCKNKLDFTRFRTTVADFPALCHTAKLAVDSKVTTVDDKIQHVKFVEPEKDKLWHFEADPAKAKELINSFFNNYALYNVDFATLEVIEDIFKKVDSAHGNSFEMFEGAGEFWGSVESWKNFIASWTEHNRYVAKLVTLIDGKSQWWTELFEPLRAILNQSPPSNDFEKQQFKETQLRLGKVPVFSQKKNLDAAHYLIRFYCQMKTLLKFNRNLLIVSLLCNGENHGKPLAVLKKFAGFTLKKLIDKAKLLKVDISSDSSAKHMQMKGFRSIAYRYLVSETQNVYIEHYGNEKYGTIELMDAIGSSSNTLVRLYDDGVRFYDVVSDDDLRMLLKARQIDNFQSNFEKLYELINNLSYNYETVQDKERFASHFPAVFASTVFEWLDCYMTATNDDLFLKMLHLRFEIDGNHLEIADFQFIVSSAMLLQVEFGCSSEFVLNFACSVPQTKLVHEFALIRIESLWRKQFVEFVKISQMLAEIASNRFKILLVTKLDARKLDDEQLMKLLTMIRHTSLSNTYLEKMSLNDMIKSSGRQELTTLNNAVMELGEVGYYIIFLRRNNKMLQASKLESMLTRPNVAYHIPEKLIAQFCMLIVNGEIDDETILFTRLLKHVTRRSRLKRTGKTSLITDENQQHEMISNVADTPEYLTIFADKQRDLWDVAKLIHGMHAGNGDLSKKSLDMAATLNDKSDQNVKLLNEIDDCICKLRDGIRLRHTQKLAIMYAIQSESNLLAQVNTGEGKSYIVAAIAIIRAKTYNFVDVITSSPILAQRDAEELQDIYSAMKVTVDHNCNQNMEERKLAYKAQIVYGEIGRFQSDYLLHSFYGKNILGERDRSNSCVIVDEVDSMLLDNGNNMLYLSHSIPGMDLLEPLFVHLERIIWSPNVQDDDGKAFATEMIKNDVLSDLLGRLPQEDVSMTASENEKANCSTIWSKLVSAKAIDDEGYLMIDRDSEFESRKSEILYYLKAETTDDHATKILVCLKAVINRPREIDIPRYLIPFCRQHLTEYIENAKRAYFMKPNEAYVIDTDRTGTDSDLTPKVTIIDQNTGVDLPTSQWSGGLHQFIQIKHGCRVNPISMKAVFVSNVSYLKGYGMINGLSGTLGSVEESNTLVELYDAELIKIPTFKAKRLYEHIPVIMDTEEKWLDALFKQVLNQVNADRSVLIILESIEKVIAVENGLLQRREKMSCNEKDVTCFNPGNMMVYKREHDEFVFGYDGKLQPGKLILATNLAGRGTDIKLSDALRDAGGLHVIVSFLSENSRIEDQAYGRAARCGDPGSCQVIAFTDQVDASGQPLSVFDLKLFRDNAEVQRLQSLTSYYNYHTKIEEDCLLAFKECYMAALVKKNNSKKELTDNANYFVNVSKLIFGTKSIDKADDKVGIPTDAEIVYFALLDEWALWLDSQDAAIRKCAVDKSEDQREKIIASVNSFLDDHPIEPIDKALDWINCPQPMLALGICRMDQNKFDEATQIFNTVIDKFPQFTGDACYYLGIITQKDVRKVKSETLAAFCPTKHVPVLSADLLDDEMCEIDDAKRIETEDYLLQAVQGFNRRVERKKERQIIISRLQQAGNPRVVKSDGFQRQTDDLANVYDALSASAYDMMGHPMSFATFANATNDIEKQFEAQEAFLECRRVGYITKKAVNHNIMNDQCEPLKEHYLLSKKKLQDLFTLMRDDSERTSFHGRTLFGANTIREHFHLPSREEFWNHLAASECFSEHQEYYVLNTDGLSGTIDELDALTTISKPYSSPLRIQLSDFDLSEKEIYDNVAVDEAFVDNQAKLEWLTEMNYLVKDASAIIDRNAFDKLGYFPEFGCFTSEELANWLEISPDDAQWIANLLLQTPNFDSVNGSICKVNESFDDSALPESLSSSVETFCIHKSMYTTAYKALQYSLEAASTDPSIKISIMLPWKPHDDLLKDLIKYGFVHDHKLELRNKKDLDNELQNACKEIELKAKPRLFIKTARLMSTEKYLKKMNVTAGIDVQTQAIHNIRHIGKVDDNYFWIFWLAVKILLTARCNGWATAFIVFNSDIKRFASVLATAIMVTAPLGTMTYFRQLFKANFRSQSNQETTYESCNRLIEFHSKTIETTEVVKKNAQLNQVITLSFVEKLNGMFQDACAYDARTDTRHLSDSLKSSNLTPRNLLTVPTCFWLNRTIGTFFLILFAPF